MNEVRHDTCIREVKGTRVDYTAEDLIGGDTLDGSLCPCLFVTMRLLLSKSNKIF